MTKIKRLKNIDVLKSVGVLCIILAHITPPRIIFQIRNFDVILMLIISAYLFFSKYSNGKVEHHYFLKRFYRLLIPTYIFLILFFLLIFLLIRPFPFNKNIIINTFNLHNGIGYVWIIRIYLLIAIILPIINKFLEKYKIGTYISVLLLYIIYEIVLYRFQFTNFIIVDYIEYIFPLLLVICLTKYIYDNFNNNKKLIILSAINLIMWIGIVLYKYYKLGIFQDTNIAKYPFRIYYLSYSFAISTLLILITKSKIIIKIFYNKLSQFISSHSLWIYLWHILFLYLFQLKNLNVFWLSKYCLIITMALLVVAIQTKIVELISKKIGNKKILNLFMG